MWFLCGTHPHSPGSGASAAALHSQWINLMIEWHKATFCGLSAPPTPNNLLMLSVFRCEFNAPVWERFTILIKVTRAIIADWTYLIWSVETFYICGRWWLFRVIDNSRCLKIPTRPCRIWWIKMTSGKVVIVLIFVGVKRQVYGYDLKFVFVLLAQKLNLRQQWHCDLNKIVFILSHSCNGRVLRNGLCW